MQISTKFNVAFLCAPKCASTSIENVIRGKCDLDISKVGEMKHLNIGMYLKYIKPLCDELVPLNSIATICMIREPLDWIQSWYRFRSRDQISDPAHASHKNYTGNISFPEFVDEFVSSGSRAPFADLPTQYDFLSLSSGEIAVDYIFPFERIDLIEDYLSMKFETRIEIPTKNVSPLADTTLDAETSIKLQAHLSKDLELHRKVTSAGVFDSKGFE
jgi:hypothetical protein